MSLWQMLLCFGLSEALTLLMLLSLLILLRWRVFSSKLVNFPRKMLSTSPKFSFSTLFSFLTRYQCSSGFTLACFPLFSLLAALRSWVPTLSLSCLSIWSIVLLTSCLLSFGRSCAGGRAWKGGTTTSQSHMRSMSLAQVLRLRLQRALEMIWSSFCSQPHSRIRRCFPILPKQLLSRIWVRRERYSRSSSLEGSACRLLSDLQVPSSRLSQLSQAYRSAIPNIQRITIRPLLNQQTHQRSSSSSQGWLGQAEAVLLRAAGGIIILLQVIQMSEQIDGFLQMGASYNFERQKLDNVRSKTIDSQGFQKWTQGNMYKSSYAHFHSKDSLEPKNTAVPGYGGYIPSVKAENIHARGYSAMAKQSFQNDKLGRNNFGISSTGFNLNKDALIDTSKLASSSKYGKTEIQRAHPGWNADWRSTTHESFKPPGALLNPTYRQTDKWLETKKADTKGSGYSTNHAYLDGKGWHPDPILKGDNHRSEYRDRLNADHPFHRDVHVSKLAQLGKKQLNYRFN